MLPLITATAVHAHTHTSTFPLWSENKRCEETGKPSTAQQFTFFSMLTSSWLAEILHSVHSYLEMQRHWLHFTRLFKTRFCASSHQTNAGEGECTLTQMPATWPTCLSVLRRKRKELEKLWNGPEIQLFFLLLPLHSCQDIFHNFAHECSVHLCVLSCQCTATVSPSETHL